MKIVSADFVKSSPRADMCPESSEPEFAFIGRSNVGKSSLINMLTERKNLAMTSSKPGKTMLINHFIINGKWYLVDLPGYGFASRGKRDRNKFIQLINHYVLDRMQMTLLFVLLDIRLEPQPIDLDFITFCGHSRGANIVLPHYVPEKPKKKSLPKKAETPKRVDPPLKPADYKTPANDRVKTWTPDDI